MYSKKIIILIFVFILFFLSPQNTIASVLINEFSPSTDPEWIELYNDGEIEINLFGYLLEDGNSSKSDDLNITGTIPAKGFIVFTHVEGWLNNSGDNIKLYNNASPSAIIDQYTYGNVDSTKSVARIPNGSENWQVTSSITNNSINPTPTSSPTPTNSPTQAPTASPTKSPTPIPTKSPTSKPTSKPTPTESGQAEESLVLEPQVLSLSTIESSPEPEITEKKKSPILAIILITLGVGFLGYGGFLLYNQKYGKNKETN